MCYSSLYVRFGRRGTDGFTSSAVSLTVKLHGSRSKLPPQVTLEAGPVARPRRRTQRLLTVEEHPHPE